MGHYYRFKRGDAVTIVSGRYQGHTGLVDSAVFQRTVDRPDRYDAGYHVVIGNGEVVTVRWNQMQSENGGVRVSRPLRVYLRVAGGPQGCAPAQARTLLCSIYGAPGKRRRLGESHGQSGARKQG